MAIKVVLLGRKASVVEDVMKTSEDPTFEFVGCTTLDELRTALEAGDVADVIMGAGIDLETRIEGIRIIFATSQGTNIHLKKGGGGPATYGPFVKTILAGLKAST